ncbi:MAG: element excision factor XisH family protein [Chloroflexi bacterium]|nr:element excision factor XisH family protein [Chloroflexota bacterium]
MPARDRYHDIVVRCLIQAGWSIIREQYAVVVAEGEDSFRRLFINITAESQTAQIVLIEVKVLDPSPVRQFLSISIYFLNPAHRKLAA